MTILCNQKKSLSSVNSLRCFFGQLEIHICMHRLQCASFQCRRGHRPEGLPQFLRASPTRRSNAANRPPFSFFLFVFAKKLSSTVTLRSSVSFPIERANGSVLNLPYPAISPYNSRNFTACCTSGTFAPAFCPTFTSYFKPIWKRITDQLSCSMS